MEANSLEGEECKNVGDEMDASPDASNISMTCLDFSITGTYVSGIRAVLRSLGVP